jgi:ABC-type multidrug transport system fused ATPase/permease subunit
MRRLNFPDWPWLLFGFIASIIHGCVPTLHGLYVGYVISDWGQEKVSKDSATTHGMRFLILACISGVSAIIKGICFSITGEYLTFRIRSLTFKSIINQDLNWFEQKGNHLGALITRLSGDAVLVQGVTGLRWGILLQGATTTLMSIGLALSYSVKLGIVGILFVILLRGVRYLEELYLSDEAEEDESNVEFGSMLVTRTITQIRTIASLHVEEKLLKDYTTSLEQSKK